MDAAIARALHFSSAPTMSPPDSSASTSSSLSQSHHHSLPSTYYAPPPVPPPHGRRSSPTGRQNHHQHLGARAGKRRSRASKRAPTTYISTDAANFRLMVQQITGVQADDAGVEVDVMMLQVQQATAAALLGDEASALRQHQLQQPCFPTLDSWNVMANCDL